VLSAQGSGNPQAPVLLPHGGAQAGRKTQQPGRLTRMSRLSIDGYCRMMGDGPTYKETGCCGFLENASITTARR